VVWQVGRPCPFPFPGYARLECGQVRSGWQVWPSGSAAEPAALRELGASAVPALTFPFALPPCKVSVPVTCRAMPEPPESLIRFLALVFSTPNFFGLGLFRTKPVSLVVATCAILVGSARGGRVGNLSSASPLVSAVKSGVSHRLWSLQRAFWGREAPG